MLAFVVDHFTTTTANLNHFPDFNDWSYFVNVILSKSSNISLEVTTFMLGVLVRENVG